MRSFRKSCNLYEKVAPDFAIKTGIKFKMEKLPCIMGALVRTPPNKQFETSFYFFFASANCDDYNVVKLIYKRF